MNYAKMDDTLNGGSQILSYSLEWDGAKGRGGIFVPIIGFPKDSLAQQLTINNGIRQGELYRFRYRARNIYGWGPYSEVSTVLAAQVPAKPKVPIFVSSTDSQMVLKFNLNVDNGGTPITLFELEAKDSADLLGSFVKITSYPGDAQTHNLNLLVDT